MSAAVAVLVVALPLSDSFYLGVPMRAGVGVHSLTDVYEREGVVEWAGQECVLKHNREVGKAIPVGTCTIGDFETAAQRILVVGDSYSAALVHGFAEMTAINDEKAVMVTSSWGASVVPDEPNVTPFNHANDYYWANVVPSLISQLRKGDVVFLVNDMASYSPPRPATETAARIAVLEGGLTKMSNTLAAKSGIGLAILNGLPFMREAGCDPSAIQWFQRIGEGLCTFLSRDITMARRAPLDAMLARLSRAIGLRVVDLMEVFCPAATCGAELGTILLYRDEFSHPSNEAAKLSAEYFQAALTGNTSGGQTPTP